MKLKLLIIVSLFLFTLPLVAQEHNDENHDNKKEKLNIGDFIVEHVSDSYEWHITAIGHTHISIPLPVILYSKKQGLVVFMSYKLHNEHHSYKNFEISHGNDMYKGKLLEKMDDGTLVRPFDISITKNVLALFIISTILIWIFLSTAKRYKQRENKAPKGLQSLLEPLILFIRDDVAIVSIGKKHYEKFMPYLLTVFFFIFFNNVMGLIPIFPGGYNLTGNITITMVLALFTFGITSIRGNKNYWAHIFWSPVVPWWLKVPLPLMPIVEILGMFTKPFVLMVRLFANIIGGHIVMLAFFSLIFIFGAQSVVAGYGASVVAVPLSLFVSLLELLVAFIQAYVFTLLSAIYFGFASEEHH